MRVKILALGALLVACSSAQPAPSAPQPASAESPKAEPAPAPAPAAEAPPASEPASEPAVPEEAAKASAAEPPASEAAAPTRRPTEILLGANVAFLVDYAASQPHETAESSCDAEAGDDAAARAECMKKARAAFRADVLEFEKDAQGKLWLTVYERKGSTLPELYKARFEFGEETPSAVTLRLKEEKGTRPFFAGTRQILVSVPSDYGIELADPKLGRLVYGAKVGLLGAR
jgi:hypothetical protein